MGLIALKNRNLKGEPLEALFNPDRGMNLISFKKGSIEVIDQSTKEEFESRYSGLGPVIGPHFHRRNPQIIPPLPSGVILPHHAALDAKGIKDPFSHGIGRYAPWKATFTETKVKATLSSQDEWLGVKIGQLEGQNFKMQFVAELLKDGLFLNLSVVSDYDSLVGIHYYYRLPQNTGQVISSVRPYYIKEGNKEALPFDWNFTPQRMLTFDLKQGADYTFFPYPDPLFGKILLKTSEYQLLTQYSSENQENSWQLYHPENASFVCIEPISSQNPRRPNLTASSIKIHLDILEAHYAPKL